jgi:hypothetical protein
MGRAVQMKNLEALKKAAEAIERKELRIGYFENAVYVDGTPVAGVAATMELGSKIERIPPRPTLIPGVRDAASEMSEAIKYASQRAIEGELDPERVLEAAGLVAQSSVQDKIRTLLEPPLAKATIAARAKRHSSSIASTKPLVDTGVMLRNVAFAVVDSEEGTEAGIHTSWDGE